MFIIALRLLVLYLVVRIIWSLVTGKKNTKARPQKKAQPPAGRFDARGKNIADADFDDV